VETGLTRSLITHVGLELWEDIGWVGRISPAILNVPVHIFTLFRAHTPCGNAAFHQNIHWTSMVVGGDEGKLLLKDTLSR
jgi:hypothetical protein